MTTPPDHSAPIRLACGCLLQPGEVSMTKGPPDAPTPPPWGISASREGVTVTWTQDDPPPTPTAATADRLALAVELDEAVRPEPWDTPEVREAYVDQLERIASDALGHCQRLERELDDLRRAHAEEPVSRLDAVELEVRRLRRELTEVRRVAHEPVTFLECPTCKALVVEADGALEVHRRSHEPMIIRGPSAGEVQEALTGPAPAWLKMDTAP